MPNFKCVNKCFYWYAANDFFIVLIMNFPSLELDHNNKNTCEGDIAITNSKQHMVVDN